MMKKIMYTKYPDSSVNDEIGEYLESMVSLIKDHIGENLISIILIGGYGRGEGTIRLRGNTALLVNDIDIVVVSYTYIEKHMLDLIMVECARIVKPDTDYFHDKFCSIDFHVDIFNLILRDLKTLTPTQFNYDLKYASSVIYGNDVLELIPELKNERIPKWDALKLICNRCLTLTEIFTPSLTRQPHNTEQSEWVYYFAIKGILDSLAGLLILYGKYVPFHEERVDVFKDIVKKHDLTTKYPDLLPIFLEYTKRKFVIRDIDLEDPLRHWCLARDILLTAFDHYFIKEGLCFQSDNIYSESKRYILRRVQERGLICRHLNHRAGEILDRYHNNPIIFQAIRYIYNFLMYLNWARLNIQYSRELPVPVRLPKINYIHAAAPCLLNSLSINDQSGNATIQIDRTGLSYVQRYFTSIDPSNEVSVISNSRDDDMKNWLICRDALINEWKSNSW